MIRNSEVDDGRCPPFFVGHGFYCCFFLSMEKVEILDDSMREILTMHD